MALEEGTYTARRLVPVGQGLEDKCNPPGGDSVILLIPLSRFFVNYEVACGRPYSKLEALILRGVEQGVGSLDELHQTFCIHRRLLIEALVTLTQAGWLAVGSTPGKSFVL